jgi:hypothetical protein
MNVDDNDDAILILHWMRTGIVKITHSFGRGMYDCMVLLVEY